MAYRSSSLSTLVTAKSGAAYFVCDDADGLYAEIGSRGIKPAEPPGDTEWRAREMTVVDRDGNKLPFSTPVRD